MEQKKVVFTREGLDLKADEYKFKCWCCKSDLRCSVCKWRTQKMNDEGAFTDTNNTVILQKKKQQKVKKEAEDETSSTGEFQARDGNATDIVSDLRNAQFKARTQVFEDKSFFWKWIKDRLTSPGNMIDLNIQILLCQLQHHQLQHQPVVTPPVIETPTVIIGNLSVNDVSSYESEGF